MVLAHDESRGAFGEDAKLTTWISRTVDIGRKTILTNGLALKKCEDGFVES